MKETSKPAILDEFLMFNKMDAYPNNHILALSANPLFSHLFDGTQQKYRWGTGFPNAYEDSHSQWTHISGIVVACSFEELVRTIQLQLEVNSYPSTLTVRWEKI